MATVRIVPREEAQVLRKRKEPGARAVRMQQFRELAEPLVKNPYEGVVYELDEGEDAQKFVLSLRGAFHRAGIHAAVRKMRARNEVHAWLAEPKTKSEPKPKAKDEPAQTPKPATRHTANRNGRKPELVGAH